MSKTLSGTYTISGYTLAGASQATLNPVTVTGSIDIGAGAIPAALYAQGPSAWTITNQGSITGGAVAGIELAAGGSIVNTQFVSGHFGLVIEGNVGGVTNSGTILANNAGTSTSAEQAIGVMLSAGGSVTNAVNAQITGQGAAVEILGGAGTLTNAGTISGPAYEGAYLSNGSVTNTSLGLIQGGDLGNGGSIGSGGSVVNSGWGVVIRNGGSLSNAGIITGIGQGGALLGGGYVENQGTIGGGWGVAINGGTGTLINAGLLDATAQSGAYLSGGSVTNTTTGRIVGVSGVVIRDAAGTLINSGSVGAISPVGYAVYLGKGFANRLVANPGAVFSGAVNGGNTAGAAAISTLELGSGTTTGTLSGIGTQFFNFGQMIVDPGASWSLDGNNSVTSGATLSNGGTLGLDGALRISGSLTSAGAVTIASTPNILASATVTGGGAWSSGGALVVGNAGTGSFLVEGTGDADAATAVFGASTGGSGDLDVSGAAARFTTSGLLTIGGAGLGSLSLESGGTVLTTEGAASPTGLLIASTAGASGSSADVSGAGSSLGVTGALVVGDAGYGSLSVSQDGAVSAASIDEAATAGGDGVISVAGTGSALTLTGSLTVGDQGAGEVAILNGATVSALDVTIGNASTLSSGNVDVEGTGSELFVGTGGVLNVGVAGGGSGVLTIGPGTTLHSNAGVVEAGHASFNNNGGVVDPPFVDITTQSNSGLGSNLYDLYVENIGAVQIVSGTGTWDTPMMLTGTSVADAQNNINVNGDVGEWQLSSGGTLIVNANTVDSGQAIVFEDATDTLVIGQIVNNGSAGVSGTPPVVEPGAENLLQAGGFAAEIWGYQTGDQIEFANMTVSSATVVNSNTVDLFGPGNVSLDSLAFFTKSGSKASNASAVAAAAQIPCFAAGTRIETVDGAVRVEDLRVGDFARLASGGSERIVWVGSRRVDCARHPKPEAVWPVRVQAGAFAANVPVRDLYLSPDHALFLDGALVPVKLLINGKSIAPAPRPFVTYYHVELPEHAVILAENLPVESYLDIGDRAIFRHGGDVVRLFPDFAARLAPETALSWETRGAAPLVLAGPALTRARRLVLDPTATASPPLDVGSGMGAVG